MKASQITKQKKGSGRLVVVRVWHCPEHGQDSTRFEGVVPAGWVFRCEGGPVYHEEHVFVAEPA